MAQKTATAAGELDYTIKGKHVAGCEEKYEFGRQRFVTRHGTDYLRVICANRDCPAELEVKCQDLLNFLLG